MENNDTINRLKQRNKLIEDYEKHQHEALAKHEEPIPWPQWVRQQLSKKPECTKCNRAKKILLRKGVRLKHADSKKR
jgi:hypothetical protein